MASKSAQPAAVIEDDAPDIWSSAVHATIPDDAWEYHIRKSLNDAAYKGLDYVPYNTTMPLTPQSDNVKFIWRKKGPH